MNESKEKKSNFKTKLNTSKSSVTKRIRKTIKTEKRNILRLHYTGYRIFRMEQMGTMDCMQQTVRRRTHEKKEGLLLHRHALPRVT